MHATSLLRLLTPTLLTITTLATSPPHPSLTTTIISRTTTPPPPTITSPPTHARLLPRTDGPIVTDGTGHWQPPFDIGGMTTHPIYRHSHTPPLRTLPTPNCPSPEYCLYYPSGVPNDEDYPSLNRQYPTTTHRSRSPETLEGIRWEAAIPPHGSGSGGGGIAYKPQRTMAVRVEWRTLDDGDVVEQRAVWEGDMREAIEEWQNRPRPTKIAQAVDAWRDRNPTKEAAKHGWGTRRPATRISEVVERWRERGERHPWTDFEGIGGTVFRGVTVIGGTAVEGMSVVGSGTVVETTVLGGKTLGTGLRRRGEAVVTGMVVGGMGTTFVRVVRRVEETVVSASARAQTAE
ncbi:MAG: hypothetical protein LQ339_000787 [Xanthoria mediterranea]|nr:MAG: hypothetical protein LQ339_000787 [Xanthoria mediterranea]